MKGRYFFVVVLWSIVFSPFFAFGQDNGREVQGPSSWSLVAQWHAYRSFSQQNGEFPMKIGYPVIRAQVPALGIAYDFVGSSAQHRFKLSFGMPSALDSDDGTGSNYLLHDNSMTYYRGGFDYHLAFPLFQWKGIKLRHGLTSGMLFEYRNLHFLSGAKEKTRDINFYLGPGLRVNYELNEQWALEGAFDGRFYLPYFNYGTLDASDPEGRMVFSSDYHGFYYQTLFSLEIAYRITSQEVVKLRVTKDDIVGFAGSEPSFRIDDIVHFKLDRIFHYTISYQF